MRRMNVFLWALLSGFSIAALVLPADAAVLKVGTCGGCTYATISAAVADSVAGDRVEVYEGAYDESVDLNTMKAKGSIALVAMGTVTMNPVSGEPGITYDKADAGDTDFPGTIYIEGFDITSDSNAIELVGVTGHVTITDCILDDSTGIGIWVSSVTGNVAILECTASNVIGIGIWANSITGNVTINNCTANDIAGIGIWTQAVFGNVSMNACTTNNVQGIGTWLIAIIGDATLRNCTANDCQPMGIYLSGATGDVTLENCNANNDDYGILLQGLSSDRTHMVRCSNMTGNRECGLSLWYGNFNVEAADNWWGDASGPAHTGNPGGSGDAICEEDAVGSEYTGTVMFDPWLAGPFERTSPCRIVSVPTLSQSGLIVLAVSMAGAAVWAGRRARGQIGS
jgi:parallel beta-helix repeat protein